MKKIALILALLLTPTFGNATDITYTDKTTGGTFTADDANEVKTAVNSKQDKPSEGAFVDGDKTKLDTIETSATADQTDSEIETAYNNQVSVVDQTTAETGTSSTVYRWTPQRVAQAIAALAGVLATYNGTHTTGTATHTTGTGTWTN